VADRQLDVLVICGSLRKGSYNAALVRTLPALAPAGMKLRAAPSFERLPIYNHDIQEASGFPAEAVAWADAIRSADALIIVSPEYNWSIPGVALQSCAGGILGGSRMQYHLRQSLTSVDAFVFGRPEVIVTFAAQKFDPSTLELKDQTAIDLIKQQLAGFEKFARRHIARE
jgi:chromate reductase